MSVNRVWFITGASRGFGKELATAVLARGDIVFAATRTGELDLTAHVGTLHRVALDVTDAGQVRAATEQALSLYGRVDVVVNNAGYGLFGAVEEATEQQLRRLFEVNFFGAWNVVRAMLPSMRAQRSGCIVNLSSIVGLVTMPGTGLYSASKFALEGLSQSLAQELAPLGIHVMLVEPGSFRTEFLTNRSLNIAEEQIADYADTAHAVVQQLVSRSGRQPGDPKKAMQAILRALDSPSPPRHLLLGSDALRRLEEARREFTSEVERWRDLSISTDF